MKSHKWSMSRIILALLAMTLFTSVAGAATVASAAPTYKTTVRSFTVVTNLIPASTAPSTLSHGILTGAVEQYLLTSVKQDAVAKHKSPAVAVQWLTSFLAKPANATAVKKSLMTQAMVKTTITTTTQVMPGAFSAQSTGIYSRTFKVWGYGISVAGVKLWSFGGTQEWTYAPVYKTILSGRSYISTAHAMFPGWGYDGEEHSLYLVKWVPWSGAPHGAHLYQDAGKFSLCYAWCIQHKVPEFQITVFGNGLFHAGPMQDYSGSLHYTVG